MLNSRKILLLFMGSIFFLMLAVNLKYLYFNCFHAVDLGIYQQAIFDISSGSSLNPFNTIRGVNIFNDHFDPIIFLAAGFIKIFPVSPFSLIIFEWLWLLVMVLTPFIFFRNEIKKAIFYSFLIIFCSASIQAIQWPIHPTTWAGFLIFLTPYFISKKKDNVVIFLCLSLLLFKEYFWLSSISLSFYYLFFVQKYRQGAIILLIGVLGAVFETQIRPAFIGSTVGYEGRYTVPFLLDPFAFILNIFKTFDYKHSFKFLYPFIIPFYFILKNLLEKKGSVRDFLSHWVVGSFCFIAPILLIHFLANAMGHHRGQQFTSLLLGIIVSSNLYETLRSKMKIQIFIVLVFFLSSMGKYTKMVKFFFFNKHRFCDLRVEKIKSFDIIKHKVKNITNSQKIISTGGIIPRILRPNQEMYLIGMYSPHQPVYDYLIIEKTGGGIYPLDTNDIKNVLRDCSVYTENIIVDNEFYYFGKGVYPTSCVNRNDFHHLDL